jgi:hypothetical protein
LNVSLNVGLDVGLDEPLDEPLKEPLDEPLIELLYVGLDIGLGCGFVRKFPTWGLGQRKFIKSTTCGLNHYCFLEEIMNACVHNLNGQDLELF